MRCGRCDYFRACRTRSCFVYETQEKCQFPQADGTSAFKYRKLRGAKGGRA